MLSSLRELLFMMCHRTETARVLTDVSEGIASTNFGLMTILRSSEIKIIPPDFSPIGQLIPSPKCILTEFFQKNHFNDDQKLDSYRKAHHAFLPIFLIWRRY